MTQDLASLLFGEHGEEVVPAKVVRADDTETEIIAWINANPPDMPEHQNNCAACGEYIPVYDTGWVCLGDGALIHYGGKHGKKCFKNWHQMRREMAQSAFENLNGEPHQ